MNPKLSNKTLISIKKKTNSQKKFINNKLMSKTTINVKLSTKKLTNLVKITLNKINNPRS